MAWLTRGGEVLASAEVALSRSERRKGLIGRTSLDGVFILEAKSVHTFGVRFPIDVAFCDSTGVVVRIVSMPRNRVCLPVWSAKTAIEAPQGAFHEWSLSEGDQLEIR
ncbi:MAG: DUF192 domain-containing protein [Microthrixaceae bacterium]|nr:DUF192 domain-containing protein [Microthrixaceae bacterium]